MNKECIANCRLENTGFNYTMSLIQGKYKMFILYTLMEFGVVPLIPILDQMCEWGDKNR